LTKYFYLVKVLRMRKILPVLIVLAAVVFLTPLYPIYAQNTAYTTAPEPSVKRVLKPALKTATTPGNLKTVMVAEQAVGRMEDVREKMASRAAELKLKLQKFKDKAKAGRVEMINSNLNAVNIRRTSEMQKSLDRISTIVAKLKTWASQQQAAGKDVTEINKIISDTESAWTQADAALKDQADNDYTITVNSESTVTTDARTARDSLRTDLKSVHDKLVSVRQNLANALSSWKGGI